jgi:hypothetical protein
MSRSPNAQTILGTNDQAVLIYDVADRATVSLLKTGSDVFAVAQDKVRYKTSQHLP